MNNRELDAKMAELMGWIVAHDPIEDRDFYCRKGIDPDSYAFDYYVDEWQPSTDIAAAMLVHLAMCESDPSTKARYFHALKDLLMEHGSFSIWTAALEYFDPLTICHAALKAVEDK